MPLSPVGKEQEPRPATFWRSQQPIAARRPGSSADEPASSSASVETSAWPPELVAELLSASLDGPVTESRACWVDRSGSPPRSVVRTTTAAAPSTLARISPSSAIATDIGPGRGRADREDGIGRVAPTVGEAQVRAARAIDPGWSGTRVAGAGDAGGAGRNWSTTSSDTQPRANPRTAHAQLDAPGSAPPRSLANLAPAIETAPAGSAPVLRIRARWGTAPSRTASTRRFRSPTVAIDSSNTSSSTPRTVLASSRTAGPIRSTNSLRATWRSIRVPLGGCAAAPERMANTLARLCR